MSLIHLVLHVHFNGVLISFLLLSKEASLGGGTVQIPFSSLTSDLLVAHKKASGWRTLSEICCGVHLACLNAAPAES